jgi:hypothetical protein
LDSYANDLDSDASALDEKSADSGLDMLMKSVPGVPGEDYPILAEAPETEFSCEGQVNGGMSCLLSCLLTFFSFCNTILI